MIIDFEGNDIVKSLTRFYFDPVKDEWVKELNEDGEILAELFAEFFTKKANP